MSFSFVDAWVRTAGCAFGTERRAYLLYAVARMQAPLVAIELGVGLAATSLMLGQALRENGSGHLYSFDNGEAWQDLSKCRELKQLREDPAVRGSWLDASSDYFEVMRSVAHDAELDEYVSFRNASVRPYSPDGSLESQRQPVLEVLRGRSIDLLFSDISCGPLDVLALLRLYLPLLSDYGSIFIDSASTLFETHLILDEVVSALNAGKCPEAILPRSMQGEDRLKILSLLTQRRFTMIHLVEKRKTTQNSLAWIQVQPVNVVPYPLSTLTFASGMEWSLKHQRDFFGHE